MNLEYRTYGSSGLQVILLHGGPGAAGYMAPIGRALADSFQVFEPFQRRGSQDQPATVSRHIEDLHDFIQARCGGRQPTLVGHSWGAMLALAYAAEYPDQAGSLVLIGCGTFDEPSRDQMEKIRSQRMTMDIKRRLINLPEVVPDPDKRLGLLGKWMKQIDSVDLIEEQPEEVQFDDLGHRRTWADMLRLQKKGIYPAAFAEIKSPAVMLHGADDPHPGRMIYESLQPYLPHLEYKEFSKCGHYPWLEKAVRDEFYRILRKQLLSKT